MKHATAFPLVPLYGELMQSQERLRLLMQSSNEGTSLQFESATDEPQGAVTELRAYIVDLREFEDEVFTKLQFEWGETEKGFIGNVTVERRR